MALPGKFVRERVRCLGAEQYQGHAAAFFFRHSAQRLFVASPILLRAAAEKVPSLVRVI